MTGKLVKIYDNGKKIIGKGFVLSLDSHLIKVKGDNLPLLKAKTKIMIEVYDEINGIHKYHCQVTVASKIQLNAVINRREPPIERRKSLKVPTDLTFNVESLWRNDENITKDFPNMKIHVLNLSIGGMLISSNYELYINDVITFSLSCEENIVLLLKAKIIRIDKTYDNTGNLSGKNYGCAFENMTTSYEDIITKYLYRRQLELYKNRQE
jgi:hypothetical protein